MCPSQAGTVHQGTQRKREMLVLTRKLMEKLYIGDEICVTVVRLEGGQVRLGIDAPREISVVRAELKPHPGSAAPNAGPPHAMPSPARPALRPRPGPPLGSDSRRRGPSR